MEGLVIKSSKGNPVTTSLIVAEVFEKEHRHVLDAIRNIIRSAENSAVLGMFYETMYLNSQNKKQPMFVMNRDGFSLLVMGFTGEKSLGWKIKFIKAFNEMENRIRSIAIPDFNDPVAAARAWADEKEKAIIAEKKVSMLFPKAVFADKVMDTENMVDIGQSAKLLKLPYGRNRLFELLRERGIFFKGRNEPKQEYVDRGYFELRQKLIERENHPSFSVKKVLVTQKGLFWLSKMLNSDYKDSLPTLSIQ